jgi:hypothetical protein
MMSSINVLQKMMLPAPMIATIGMRSSCYYLVNDMLGPEGVSRKGAKGAKNQLLGVLGVLA